MSIDLTKVTGISDQYGAWKQVADAAGNVLWKQKPAGATVTITIVGNGGNYASVVIDGVTYNTETTLTVPFGATITCVATGFNEKCAISCNYEKVASGSMNLQYEYTVVSDVTITLFNTTARPGSTETSYYYGTIDIVDANAPDWPLVNITGSAYNGSGSVTIDGTVYTNAAKVHVPIGTVVTCSATWKTSYYGGAASGGEVSLNGTVVAPRNTAVNPTTYEYTVSGDVEIAMNYGVVPIGSTGQMGYFGLIKITEQ